MSLNPTKTLSLVQNILREQTSPAEGTRTTSPAFSNRLDQALERGIVPDTTSAEALQRAADALRLDTLRNSMELLDDQTDQSDGMRLPQPGPLPAAPPSIQAYLANLATPSATGTATPPAATLPLPAPLEEPGPQPLNRLSLLQDSAKHTGLDPIIQKASRQYGVDAALIRAVIKTESNFNPRAVSPVGAQGLMQLMPATARGLGVNNAFDPEQNVMGGTKFLKDLLNRYKGDLDAALAAYNWGPGNVDRRPERLPRETRDYLVRVKQLYASYSA